MNSNKVELVEYSHGIETANCLTHAVGVLFAAAAGSALVIKAVHGGSRTAVLSCCVYMLTFLAVYLSSAVYHGLKPGRAKLIWRRLDHIAIPLLLAGMTTPCALVTLYRINPVHGIIVFAAGWCIALWGIIVKLFFFGRFKALTMVIYFAGGAALLLSAVPVLGEINKTAFLLLALGCAAYCIGGVLCRLGMKKPCLHPVFHAFVLAGSVIHFFVVYTFII